MRPTKLTPETQERIVRAIKVGNFRDIAARYAGIDPGTFYRWMDRGRKALYVLEELREASYQELRKRVGRDPTLIDYPIFSEEDPLQEVERKRLPKRPTKAMLVAGLWADDAKYAKFREAVTRATAEAEVEAVTLLRKLGREGDSKAVQFYLERAHADRWGRRDRLAIEQIPDEALQAEARRLQQEIAAARTETDRAAT